MTNVGEGIPEAHSAHLKALLSKSISQLCKILTRCTRPHAHHHFVLAVLGASQLVVHMYRARGPWDVEVA